MLRIILASAILLAGCSNTAGLKRPKQPDPAHATPVEPKMPTLSQKLIYQRLHDGQNATGGIDIEGSVKP